MNQNKSESINNEMKSFKQECEDANNSHAKYLEEIEAQLGIKNDIESKGKEAFIRESDYVKELKWSTLVKEANEEINYDVDFEDLLSEDEFKDAYKNIKEIDVEFEKKTGIRKKDFAFLTVAISLQCTRQYILDAWIKSQRSKAVSNDEEGRKGNAEPGWYYIDTDKILTNKDLMYNQRGIRRQLKWQKNKGNTTWNTKSKP